MIEGEDIALRRIFAHAKRRGLEFKRRLGSGIHGVVFEARSNAFPGFVAVRAHRDAVFLLDVHPGNISFDGS
jgi:hypothetical protein